jgi:hypothetical protein
MFYSLDAQSDRPGDFKLFRPMRVLACAVLYWLGGKPLPQPWLFHLANVITHAGVSMLLFAVAKRLFARWSADASHERVQSVALWIALAYAVHPVVSEVVCWAKALDDELAALFTLCSAWCLLTWDRNRQPLTGALVFFAFAVYSKISAIPFAAAALLIARFQGLGWRHSVIKSYGFFIIALLFMAHRHWVMGRSSQTAPISGTYAQTLVDMLPVVPAYARLLGGIPPFCIDYTYLTGHYQLLSPWVLTGLLFFLVAGAAAAWLWRASHWRLASFGLIWIGLFLLPVSNVLPMMQYMAERFLYLPLIGWVLLVGSLLGLRLHAHLGAAIGVALLIGWGWLAWDRSLIWKDDLTLFVQSSQQGRHIQRVEENAVGAIFLQPQVSEVFRLEGTDRDVRTVSHPPPDRRAALQQTLESAHELFPNDPTVASALGILEEWNGHADRAAACYEIAARRRTGNATHLARWGRALVDSGSLTPAREILSCALSLDPRNVEAWRGRVCLHFKQAEYAEALGALETLKRLGSGDPEIDAQISDIQDHLAGDALQSLPKHSPVQPPTE